MTATPHENHIADLLTRDPRGGSVHAREADRCADVDCDTPHDHSPQAGYMVSRPDSEWRVPATASADVAPVYVRHYLASVNGRGGNVYFGAWRDGDHVYLDLSDRIDDAATAIKLGRSRGQLAIWDVAAGVEIRL